MPHLPQATTIAWPMRELLQLGKNPCKTESNELEKA